MTCKFKQRLRRKAIFGVLTACALSSLSTVSVGQTMGDDADQAQLASAANIDGAQKDGMRKPIAVVNGAVITGTDLNQRLALLIANSQANLSPEEMRYARMQVLRNLIDETIQIQAAEAQELKVDNAMVENRYREVAARNFGEGAAGLNKMNAHLAKLGSSADSLKRQIRGEVAWQLLVQRNISSFINVSNEEAQEQLKALEATKGTTEYRIGEIFMRSTPENRDSVLRNAQTIVDQLKQGGNFAAYARQYSEASTATVGGDLGFVQLNRLPGELAQEVAQMSTGELVGPIEIPGGFSIIALIDKKQILMADPRDSILSLKQISLNIPAGQTPAQMNKKLEEFNAAIDEIQTCDMAESVAARIGAEVIPNDSLQARALPPQLQSILLDMQIGQKTPAFGSQEEGIRVLMLCGRQSPAEENAQSVEQIRQELENERVDKRAQAYLRDLRNDADVKYN